MKKIYSLLMLLAACGAFSSCSNEVDDVFSKSSAERINDALITDKELLTAPGNGWIMEYYGSTIYGGYNVLCKFNADNTVTVASEIYGSDSVATSHFKLEQSQGAILSFDDYNPVFHYFSEPANADQIGDNGKGMLGDFEFRVQSASADTIVLVGKKHDSRIVMTPMPEGTTWKSYLEAVRKVDTEMDAKFYSYVDGTTESAASKGYHVITVPDTTTGSRVDVDMPYITTPEGLKFYKPYTVNGKTITGFRYAEGKTEFEAFDNSSIKLKQEIYPLSQQLLSADWYINVAGMGKYGAQYYLYMRDEIMPQIGEVIQQMYLGTRDGKNYGLVFQSGTYWGVIYLTTKAVDDTHVMMQARGTGDGNGGWYLKNGLFEYYMYPFGYDKPKSFTLTSNNPKNAKWIKLTDDSDPTNTITLYAKKQTLPLGN
jgi:hypothetical protein